jgi:hypothetical protein
MELEALEGAQQTIARCHPIFLLEFRARPAASACASSSTRAATRRFEAGYNLLAVHKSDPVVQQLQLSDMPAQSAA